MTNPFEAVSAFKGDVDSTRENIFAGLRNQEPTTTTPADILSAAMDATANQTSVSATAARLDATLTRLTQGGGGGGDDQFERTDTDLGSDWSVVDSGTGGSLQTDGHRALWNPAGSSANWAIAKNETVATSNDNQLARLVLAEPLNTTSGWLITLRMNSAQDTYVYGLVKKDYLEIGYVVSGIKTVSDSWTDPLDPPPGARIDFYADGSDFYLSAGAVNANATAPVSGASYRHIGFGADIQPADGVQVSPGSLELWAGFDWSAPPVAGVYLEAKPSTGVTPSSGVNAFPDEAFDDVVYQSDWLTYDPADLNKVTVQLPGAYLVELRWVMNTQMASGDTVVLGCNFGNFSQVFSGTFLNIAQYTTVMYLNAADTIIPIYSWSGTPRELTTGSVFKVTKLSPPFFA